MRKSLIFVVFALGTASVNSTTIHVPADQPTVQAGINASSDGDTVLVQPDTYVENINFNGRNIVLGSLFLTTGDTSYISSTIIDGDSSGSVVRFVNGEYSTAVITGFTIQNVFAPSAGGGGLLCEGSEPTISHNIISGNSSGGDGGAIHCAFESSPTISDNVIRGNSASGAGGGISCYIANATITNNTITGNSGGGGIHCGYCTNPTITNNTITENSSDGGAGGISLFDSNPTISNNIISNNSTAAGGGGIFCAYCTSPMISDNTISGNSAGWDGGAITLFDSDATITDNTITGNSDGGDGGWGGGAIYFAYSDPVITNNTISENVTANSGGGIQSFDSNPTINNNIIRNNSADIEGGGIQLSDCSSSTITDNAISGNSAKGGGGGGIQLAYSSNPTISRNTISGNSANDDGGGIHCWHSSPTISNNTVSGNSAPRWGGGISCFDNSNPTLENSIIAFCSDGEGVYCDPSSNPTLTCCDIFGNEGGDWVGCIAGQAGINGNFSLDPLFCDTANADYHISSTSPCALRNNSCRVLIGAHDVGCQGDFVCGDADDGDSLVTLDDVMYLWSFYFEGGPPPKIFVACDVNCDDAINLVDIVYLALYVSGDDPGLCCAPPDGPDDEKYDMFQH